MKLRWPFLVWLAFAGLALWMFYNTGKIEQIAGVVEIVSEPVASLEEGRIKTVAVKPGSQVKPGDIIAQLDTTLIDEEIAELQLELSIERLDRIRQFTDTILRIEEELRVLRLKQTSDTGQLAYLKEEIKRLEKEIEAGAITRDVVVPFQAQAAALVETTKLYPTLITEANTALTKAKGQLRSAEGEPATAADPESAGAAQFGLLLKRKEACTLKAIKGGYIADVLHQPGEVLSAGLPVATIIVDESPRIFGFIIDTSGIAVEIGQEVKISNTLDGKVGFTGKVIAISPYIKNLPDRSSPLPNRMVRGREIIIMPDENATNLVPGQSVLIYLKERNLSDIFPYLNNNSPAE